MIRNAIGHLIKEDNGTFSVVFPDFPGAAGNGDTHDEAIARASENLSAHIEGMLEAGLALPDPEKRDPLAPFNNPDLIAFVMVPLELPGRAVRINITVDEGLLGRIDKAAARHGESRSGFLASAARKRLSEDA